MIRIVLAAILAMALGACASTAPPTPVQAASVSRSAGAATIALWGTWEWELAPAYTSVAMLRRDAAKQLDAGRITKAAAQGVQAAADRARAKLDEARRGNAAEPTRAQRAAHAEALRIITVGQSLLEP